MNTFLSNEATTPMQSISKSRLVLWLWVSALLVSACSFEDSGGGCGDSVTNNFRFDRWCGDKLCNWTTLTGDDSIRRVPTWHENDYGVSLESTPTVITQLRHVSGTACFKMSMVADVEATAEVKVGIDYNFDGDPADPADEAEVSPDLAVDREFDVPAAHWKRFEFLFPTPTHYSGLRFVIRKSGTGRAVLAELRVEASGECTAERPPARNLPLGASCGDVEQCQSGNYCSDTAPERNFEPYCEVLELPQWFCEGVPWREACVMETPDLECETIAWDDWWASYCPDRFDSTWEECAAVAPDPLEAPEPGDGPGQCSECATDEECSDGQVCGVLRSRRGPYRACVPLGEIGDRCNLDAQCESERCMPLSGYGELFEGYAACSSCESDADCDGGDVCGLNPEIPARQCVAAAQKPIATLCESDGECISGICCSGRCAECCSGREQACSGLCTSSSSFGSDEPARVVPNHCDAKPPVDGGAECLQDADCASGVCEGATDVCFESQHCLGDACDQEIPDCELITIAGRCQ